MYVPSATCIVADVSPPTIAASDAVIAAPMVLNGKADVPGLPSLPVVATKKSAAWTGVDISIAPSASALTAADLTNLVFMAFSSLLVVRLAVVNSWFVGYHGV